MNGGIVVYLDFDGTVVEHTFPSVGQPNPGALDVVRKLIGAGHEIILNTMRVHFGQKPMLDSIYYLSANGIEDFIPSKNKHHPLRWDVKEAVKSGELYIDDAAPNMPLIPAIHSKGDMVDWKKVESQLIENGII